MNCTTAQERFADLLDARVSDAASTADVRAHLASCPDCQREYAALAQTLAALDALPAAKPGPALRKNFYAMLEEEKNSAASIAATVTRRRHAARVSLWRWILIPVASGALAVAAFLAGTRYAPPVASGPDDATRKEIADLHRQVAQLANDTLNYQRSTTDRLRACSPRSTRRIPTRRSSPT
jgi:predicted anti-sigma-YlaC factor YlaD